MLYQVLNDTSEHLYTCTAHVLQETTADCKHMTLQSSAVVPTFLYSRDYSRAKKQSMQHCYTQRDVPNVEAMYGTG